VDVKRGDIVAIALSGDYGKPRPALVVQANVFGALPSVTVLPMTSEQHDEHLVRVPVHPDDQNGLHSVSQVMVDKASTVPRAKVGGLIGRLDGATLKAVEIALSRFLGLSA
jgi:mRNA interferase MazF